MMDVQEIFLTILQVISDSITSLISILPNPDPFPAIIEGLQISSSTPGALAYYWVNVFVDVPFIVGVFASYFTMFGVAWIIMLIWKWLKAR